MIAYSEIEAGSAEAGVSPQTLEKDYHLDWYLAALWSEKVFPQFAFYGGTAIKKLYVPHHRFSEDIDLISNERLSPDSIRRALDQAQKFLEREANLFYSYRPDEIQIAGTQTRFVIHYRGFSELGGIKQFLLDFAQGIEGLPDFISKDLISSYRDLKTRKVPIRALPLEVICADKLALIVERRRKEPRDIYDLWSVFMQVKNFDRHSFLNRCQKVSPLSTNLSVIDSTLKDMDFKKAWETRLKYQVPSLPDFEVVLLELEKKLETIFSKKRDG